MEDSKGQKRDREEPQPTTEEAPKDDTEESVHGTDVYMNEPDPKRQLTRSQPEGVVEEGRIYFFYRPRVGLKEAESLSDTQRFHIILSPTSRKDAPNRLVAIGKKRLPDPAKHERFFGFVQATDKQMGQLTAGMGPKENETKTRGVRRTEAARALGEGVYSIVDHGRDTHLVYELEVPGTPGEVQEDFKISSVGNFTICIKNPDVKNPPNAGLGGGQKADYPEDKKKQFEGTPGGYNWISAKDPSLLDFNGCELLLIAAKPDAQGELGGELEEHLEEAKEQDAKDAQHFNASDQDSQMVAKLKEELHADQHEVSVEPAAEGTWK